MRALAAVTSVAACVQPGDPGGPWEPLEVVEGELAGEVGAAPPPAVAASCVVRVASFNVHYAEDPAALVASIRASRYVSAADVLLVQETRAVPDEPASRTRRIAEGLGMSWVYAPTRAIRDAGGTHGNAILSRFPLEDPAIRRLPFIEQPYHPEARRALAADVMLGPDDRLRVVNVHLDVRLAPVDRVRQLDPAVRDTDDRVVVGGDFNTAPWTWLEGLVPLTASEAVLGQEQAAVLDDFMAARRFASALPVEAATMRVPGFSMRLDNVYARDLTIVAAGVEHVEGSDHWPVWADLDRCR